MHKTFFARLLLLAALALCSTGIVSAQFIVNGDFENTSDPNLPANLQHQTFSGDDELAKYTSWWNTTYGTSDYYNKRANYGLVGGTVTVPLNVMNNYVSPGTPDPSNKEAYAGIYVIQNRNGSTVTQYREYISEHLLAPLRGGHTYKVRYKVSLGINQNSVAFPAIKSIGAWFSYSNPKITTPANYEGVYPLPSGETPQIDNTGSLLNTIHTWTTIEEYYTVPGSDIEANKKYYITIGNFQQNIPDNEVSTLDADHIITYYYIDDVEIEEIIPENCLCDYTVIPTIRKDSPSGQCCYDFAIQSKVYSCPVKKIDFSVNGQTVSHTFTTPLGQSQNTTLSNICFNGFEGSKTLTITFYDVNDAVICTQTKQIECMCNCSNVNVDQSIDIYIERAEGSGDECCWNIWARNSKSCDFSIYGIKLSGYGNTATLSSGDWVPTSQNSYTLWQSTAGNTSNIIRNGTKIRLGTICLPAGTPQQLLTFTFLRTPGTISCTKEINAIISCGTPPQEENCCDKFRFGTLSIPGSCHHEIFVTQEPTALCKACDIEVNGFSAKKGKNGGAISFPAKFPWESGGNFAPFGLFSLKGPGTFYICLVDCSTQRPHEFCCHDVTLTCSSIIGSGKRPDDIGSEHDEEFGLSIVPNPVDKESSLKFRLEMESTVLLDLFDSNGQFIESIANGSLKAGEYTIPFETRQLTSGTYILKLSVDGTMTTHAFQVVR